MNIDKVFGATVLGLFVITNFALRDIKLMLQRQEALLQAIYAQIPNAKGGITTREASNGTNK